MDHTNHIRLSPEELTAEVLEGATIYDRDDSKIGSVNHVHGLGTSTQVVIDVGGFLGIGAKPVSVSASDLDFMRDEDGDVHAVTSWTKEQLKEMPEHMDE
ncbi:PRC-barrel domain containing protein [Mesorhizobium sp. IMUNJ 23232]|uniref:PRC-barrel domain containing protein n=1 Tax=Mesorhizobium sp. IMUNJ 23232 TaxID=3376064 RepID=UPI0037995DF6